MSPRSVPVTAFPPQPRTTTGDRLSAAAARVRRQWNERPTVGLILGSGLHGLVDVIDIEATFEFSDLPGFLTPTATGHRGRLICGSLAGLPVIACQGRLHGYEGHQRAQLGFPMRLFAELGCGLAVLSNAAGGVNPRYRVGDVMIVTGHVDLIGRPALPGWISHDEHGCRTDCYDAGLAATAYQLGITAGRPVHQGVYAALDGPNYETRAEYRMLRTLGIDTVGMSTAPEAVAAYEHGLRVLALSTVTNACDPDALGETSGEAVIAAAEAAEAHVRGIVWDVLSQMDAE